MPEMEREWMVPATKFHPQLKFTLREPPLTGDDLGLKTWVTSFVVSKRIGQLGHDNFSHLLGEGEYHSNSMNRSMAQRSVQVLELGSGTGLVGISAAAIWGVPVLVTDLRPIQENLNHNICANIDAITGSGGSVSCNILDWRYPEEAFPEERKFEIIIAADPLYDDYHPIALAQTIDVFLKKDDRARVVVAIPLRDKHTVCLSLQFKERMFSRHFVIVKVCEDSCIDEDWAGSRNCTDEIPVEMIIWQLSRI